MSVDPSELESRFRFVENTKSTNWQDQVRAIIAAEATFYFIDLEAAKSGLVAAYERVMSVLRPHVTQFATEKMRRARRIAPEVDRLLEKWLLAEQLEPEWYSLTVKSGNALEAVGPWGLEFGVNPPALAPPDPSRDAAYAEFLRVVGSPKAPEAGYFHFSLPVHSIYEDDSTFRRLVLDVAERVPFRSGHAGFGIQSAKGYVKHKRDQQIHSWAQRFRGLDCRDLIGTARQMNQHIKGVNWLTLLDNDFVEQLGGEATLASSLGDGFPIRKVPHGLVIQAGPEPLLGDVNQLEDMTPYVKVNEVTRPLRVPDLKSPLPGFEPDTTNEWIRRFDQTT